MHSILSKSKTSKHVWLRQLSRQRRDGLTTLTPKLDQQTFQTSRRSGIESRDFSAKGKVRMLFNSDRIHVSSTRLRHSYNYRVFSTAAAVRPDKDDDDDDEVSLEAEIDALAASCFDLDEYTNDIREDWMALRQQRLRMEHSSLDLELGETSVWDSPTDLDDDDDDESSSSLEEEEDDNPLAFPDFPAGSPAAELKRQEQQLQSHTSTSHQPVLSPLDVLEELSLDSPEEPRQTPQDYDPLSYKGPAPAEEDDMHRVQLRLECEAQREAVEKYQRITEATRSRKDYASLNSLQKLILQWYQPVRDEIDQEQRKYIFRSLINDKKEKPPKKNKKQEKPKKGKPANPAITRYGPMLNTVEPEKLAIIATHEALTLVIAKSKDTNNYRGGCAVVSLALKLGQAVEQEMLLQRMIRKVMEEESAKEKQEKEDAEMNPAVADFAKETLGSQPQSAAAAPEKEVKPFSYVESRLTSYLEKISNADKKVSLKTRRNIAYAVHKARRSLHAEKWTDKDHVHVGSILLKILLENATMRLPDGTVQPAFRMETRWNSTGFAGHRKSSPRFKSTNFILIHDALWKLAVADEFESIAATTTRHKPMVVPPEPWTSPQHGGYAWLKTELIRFHGSQMQREALDGADLTTVLDGLNVLGQEAWIINKKILQVADQCWEKNISLGDVPSRTDLVVPPEPFPPEKTTFIEVDDPNYDEEYAAKQKEHYVKEYRSFLEARNRHRRSLQKNRDLFSLRCSLHLKMGQARQFQEYEKIYFPYNMDFRGRAYPVPPHLSNVGSDLCRGMLTFAESKPLGKRGLFWLQVHLANLAGMDKMTFEDRAQYTINNMANVRKAFEDPFEFSSTTTDGEETSEERPWWMSLDDPFQGLATCHEIVNAIDSGNPETYLCSLPVHMDGSCNGLQHYAALGRDVVGGTAVNLLNYPEPKDVYIGVMDEVIRRVVEESKRELDFDEPSSAKDESLSKQQRKELLRNRSAKLVNGLIDRGVVKRTVMTSVYGVTYIGARQQILEKIEEKLEEEGRDLDEITYEVWGASGYLAEVTMNVIGDLFTGAKETMNWLTQCARLLSGKGYPVAWITPLGLPAIQPYRQQRSSRIVTALASITVKAHSDDLPIHKTRSASAFPPNYIHSLDSTHMLMTALEMDRRGLSFSAVHDSFWTHPCDVDEMNEALRDQFIELYSQPLLEELKQSFELRYPDINFPDLPERGLLDLNEVKESKFFFQ